MLFFPLSISKSRTSQRCPRNCSGVLAVTFLEGAQGLLSRFVRVYPVFRLHHSRGRRGCSGGLVVASLEETQGLLSRFDSCVFRLHHSRGRRGCSGGLPWAYRPGASFSLHTLSHVANESRVWGVSIVWQRKRVYGRRRIIQQQVLQHRRPRV